MISSPHLDDGNTSNDVVHGADAEDSTHHKMKIASLLLPLCGIAGCNPTWTEHDGLTVETSSGYVRGKIDVGSPDVRQFLGIPFAQPPLQDLRFAAPKPLEAPASDVIEATKLPPSCMQWLGTAASVYTREVLEFNLQGLNRTGSVSEDCLTLSIWTPAEVHEPLPVLIYIFGGGFTTGGQDVPYQIPTQWVQRTQDHIVVVFNYRLNIFGFPNAAGLDSPNVGLLDQRLAVEWTRENIAAFGGDASRMVLWGQSAGASSVFYYLYSYYDNPIISGFISDSGALQESAAPPTTNFTFIANSLGCSDPANELSCLRAVPASTINNFLANYSNTRAQPPLPFRPVPDDVTVPINSTQRVANKQLPAVPGIVGTNSQDGVPFAPYSASGPNTTLAERARLSTFFCPSTYQIALRQQMGLDTFSYFYGGNFSNISPEPWMGAYHSGELPLIFGTHPNYRGESTQFEKETSMAIQDAYVAFARGGTSGLEAAGWLRYEHLGQATVRNFGNATTGEAEGNIAMGWSEGACDGPNVRS